MEQRLLVGNPFQGTKGPGILDNVVKAPLERRLVLRTRERQRIAFLEIVGCLGDLGRRQAALVLAHLYAGQERLPRRDLQGDWCPF